MGNLEAKGEEEVMGYIKPFNNPHNPKKKKKPLTFAQKLEKTIQKHQRRQEESMALFRAEQRRQGLRPDQPISLLDMVKGMEKRKKK
jgi:hypothetical protein